VFEVVVAWALWEGNGVGRAGGGYLIT
jgi:hypothetical protein